MNTPAASPAQARAIRQRLLERVADSDDSHLTVPAGAAGWQPFFDGVRIKVLHEKDGVLSYLLHLAPGARLDAHRHPQDEECLVLEGVLKVGSQIEVGPGGYHLARAGSLHASISTETGATIFLRGAEPHMDQLLV
ncbi:MAG: cupin domain-containing protein [Proteobacteria bacterium]|jgi:quercetin dioxygenase-like cupin family protein|nr:cupin domain-containing protein [Burkholderiaceae bacterium]MCH8857940.1 cupin domain-containing protein [Pseudomonadota bacterium]